MIHYFRIYVVFSLFAFQEKTVDWNAEEIYYLLENDFAILLNNHDIFLTNLIANEIYSNIIVTKINELYGNDNINVREETHLLAKQQHTLYNTKFIMHAMCCIDCAVYLCVALFLFALLIFLSFFVFFFCNILDSNKSIQHFGKCAYDKCK
jgi:hypothetical protein